MARFGVQNKAHQSAKRQRSNVRQQNDSEGEDNNPAGNQSNNVIIADKDVLDCPICTEPLNAPIFQCENGHIICDGCSRKVKNGCPSCSFPVGHIRCLGIEKILEQCRIPCSNAKYGCKEVLRYGNKLDHEKNCNHAPCLCPHSRCDFDGSLEQFSEHLREKHRDSVMHFAFEDKFSTDPFCFGMFRFLKEEANGYLFLIKKSFTNIGYEYVVCPGCTRAQKIDFSYTLTANNHRTSLQITSSSVGRGGDGDSYGNGNFLLIPKDFFGSDGGKLDVLIFAL